MSTFKKGFTIGATVAATQSIITALGGNLEVKVDNGHVWLQMSGAIKAFPVNKIDPLEIKTYLLELVQDLVNTKLGVR